MPFPLLQDFLESVGAEQEKVLRVIEDLQGRADAVRGDYADALAKMKGLSFETVMAMCGSNIIDTPMAFLAPFGGTLGAALGKLGVGCPELAAEVSGGYPEDFIQARCKTLIDDSTNKAIAAEMCWRKWEGPKGEVPEEGGLECRPLQNDADAALLKMRECREKPPFETIPNPDDPIDRGILQEIGVRVALGAFAFGFVKDQTVIGKLIGAAVERFGGVLSAVKERVS